MSKLKPDLRPANPNFSSGPCAKRPDIPFKLWKMPVLGVRTGQSRARPSSPKLLTARARAGRAGKLSYRHCAGLRHRRL